MALAVAPGSLHFSSSNPWSQEERRQVTIQGVQHGQKQLPVMQSLKACCSLPSSNKAWSPRTARALPRSAKASAAGTQSAEADTVQGQREELKSRLDSLLATTNGNLTEESKEVIAQLEKLNPTTEPAYKEEIASGHFILANSTMTGVLYKGAILTLGRLTFNQFQPTSLKVKMLDVYNDVGVPDPADYHLVTLFEVIEDGLPPLIGLSISTAKWKTVSPQRVELEFVNSQIQPRYPDKDLEAWKKIVQDGNPTMTDDGVIAKQMKAKGWLDFMYLDEDLRITVGQHGSIVVVRRLPQKEIEYQLKG